MATDLKESLGGRNKKNYHVTEKFLKDGHRMKSIRQQSTISMNHMVEKKSPIFLSKLVPKRPRKSENTVPIEPKLPSRSSASSLSSQVTQLLSPSPNISSSRSITRERSSNTTLSNQELPSMPTLPTRNSIPNSSPEFLIKKNTQRSIFLSNYSCEYCEPRRKEKCIPLYYKKPNDLQSYLKSFKIHPSRIQRNINYILNSFEKRE